MSNTQKRNNKLLKGDFGYLPVAKKRNVFHTIVLFAISLSIFLAGYLYNGTRLNILTVAAMLGMLPASKSAVEMILYLRQANCSSEIHEKIVLHAGALPIAYELVLTSYDKNFPISAIAVHGNAVCGYSENEKCDGNAAEKHMTDILKQNGYKPAIKIFKELEKFNNRLDALRELDSESREKDLEILEVIKAISI